MARPTVIRLRLDTGRFRRDLARCDEAFIRIFPRHIREALRELKANALAALQEASIMLGEMEHTAGRCP